LKRRLECGEPFAAERAYRLRPGVSLNLEQQVSETVGVFARAGWADGNLEPWDNTDIDRTVEAGVSIIGKNWGRPNDTIGLAGVINGLAPIHAAYFEAGGMGIVIGDGQLNYGLEQTQGDAQVFAKRMIARYRRTPPG
jgi:high affinity Mn2+ porin